MKKNIIYFTPYYLPTNNAAAVRSYWFVKTLLGEGHFVKLITGKDLIFKIPKNTDSALMRLFKEQLAGIELGLRILLSKGDLYILSSPPFFTVLVASLACKLLRKSYILDIRDLYPEVFLNLGLVDQESSAYKYLLSITRLAYRNAKSIITVTSGLERAIKRHTPQAKVVLVYNGYDKDLFRPNKIKFSKTTIVFHGNLGKFQRIDLLAEIAKRMEKTHPNVRFKVIGKGPEEKHLIPPPSNLEFIGEMEYRKLASYISKCHIGISFRTNDKISQEAFPVKVFEYLGVELPIVITPKEGEAADFIQKNGFGYAASNNAEEVIKCLEILIEKRGSEQSFKKTHFAFSRQAQAEKIKYLV